MKQELNVSVMLYLGTLMLNMIARSKTVRIEALKSLHDVFPSIVILDVREDINKVVLASPSAREGVVSNTTACDKERSAKEQLGEDSYLERVMLTPQVVDSIRRFSEIVTSFSDFDSESFHSDLLASFSNMNKFNKC